MARRPSFRLERLLELKTRREQALAARLGQAEEAARAERAAEHAIAALRAAGVDARLAPGRRTAGDIQSMQAVVERLDVRLTAQQARTAAAETTVTEAQRLLTTAHQERRVLDRLKEKHVDQLRHADADHDRKTMDEVAVARFLHQRVSDA